MRRWIVYLISSFGAMVSESQGQGPSFMNYQGRLLNGTNLVNGNVGLTLRIYNVSVGGSILYADSNTVAVADGLYATSIGDNTISGSLDRVLTNSQVWLEAVVNGTVLTPRERISAVPYAMAVKGLLVDSTNNIILNPLIGSNVVDASATFSAIGGGQRNSISSNSTAATIAGGSDNQTGILSTYASIGGGSENQLASSQAGTIGGGIQNSIGPLSENSTISGGSGNTILTFAGGAVIAGGLNNTVSTNGDFGAIGGGANNTIGTLSSHSAIAGGQLNRIGTNSGVSAIGGGFSNVIANTAAYATIPGGRQNAVGTSATNAFAAGHRAKANHAGTFVWGDVTTADVTSTTNNQVTFRANGGFRVLGGAIEGNAAGLSNFPAGLLQNGTTNSHSVTFSTNNTILTQYGFIGGGQYNVVDGGHSIVGGGYSNRISLGAAYAAIVGGADNDVIESFGSIGGGYENYAAGQYAAIGGGRANQVTGDYGTIPGGLSNAAVAYAFAAGRRAKANHEGAFVWADSENANFSSITTNEVALRANKGVRINSGDSPGIMLNSANRALVTRGWDAFTSGVHNAAGRWGLFMETSRLVAGIPNLAGREFHIGRYEADSTYTSLVRVTQSGDLFTLGTVNPPSDRNVKRDFQDVDPREVAAKVAALPLQSWQYIHDGSMSRHLGPTAQDFHAAFSLGSTNTSISTIDADGVALTAIKGLYLENEELRKENETMRRELDAIRRHLGL